MFLLKINIFFDMEKAQPVGGKFENRLPVVTRVHKCAGAGGDPSESSRWGEFTKEVVDP